MNFRRSFALSPGSAARRAAARCASTAAGTRFFVRRRSLRKRLNASWSDWPSTPALPSGRPNWSRPSSLVVGALEGMWRGGAGGTLARSCGVGGAFSVSFLVSVVAAIGATVASRGVGGAVSAPRALVGVVAAAGAAIPFTSPRTIVLCRVCCASSRCHFQVPNDFAPQSAAG